MGHFVANARSTLTAGACDVVPWTCHFPAPPQQPLHSLPRAAAAVHFDCWRACCCTLDMPLPPLRPVSNTPPKGRRSTHCLSPVLLGTLIAVHGAFK